MAATEVLAPEQTPDPFFKPAIAFMQAGGQNDPAKRSKINFKQVMNAEVPSDTRFTLQNEHFITIQLYINTAFKVPGTEALFETTYPKPNFKEFLSENNYADYELMKKTLVAINQHCTSFEKDVINPMVILGATVSNFASEAKDLVEAFKEQLEILCTPSISKADWEQAKENATSALSVLKDNAKGVNSKSKKLSDDTSEFKTTTKKDNEALDKVIARLNLVMSEEKLGAALTASIKKVRESLKPLQQKGADAARKANSQSGLKWYYFLPTVGPIMMGINHKAGMDACNEAERAQREYDAEVIASGRTKQQLVNANDCARTLLNSIKGIDNAIDKAEGALQHIMNAMGQMVADSDIIVEKLNAIDEGVKGPQTMKAFLTGLQLDAAIKAWNKVYDLAKQFQATGIIMDAEAKKAQLPPPSKLEPEILGAHYGSLEITSYAKLLFVNGHNLDIDTNDMPFQDPWEGIEKTMSILYRHDGKLRLFAGPTDNPNRKYLIKPGAIDPSQNVSEAFQVDPPAGSNITILAVAWGPSQVTGRDEILKLYRAASMSSRVEIRGWTFSPTDPWTGKNKSAAIYYQLPNGTYKSIAGKEWTDTIAWAF